MTPNPESNRLNKITAMSEKEGRSDAIPEPNNLGEEARQLDAEPSAREFDLTTEHAETNAFIQWKGTDVCMDFRCECGEGGHFDGFFAYVVKCPGCGVLWEMPMNLFPRRSLRDPAHGCVVELEPYED